LATTIGLPYFLLSTTGPLLQAWYVRYTKTGIPWRLFALSNAASLAALLTYPVLVEPALSVPQQAWVWTGFYVVFLILAGLVRGNMRQLKHRWRRPRKRQRIPLRSRFVRYGLRWRLARRYCCWASPRT